MTTRAPDKRVTFIRPFVLEGLEGVQPSGAYSVKTREEHAEFFSFLCTKQTSTWIQVCQNSGVSGVLQLVNIDPRNLAAAPIRDAVPAEVAGTKLR